MHHHGSELDRVDDIIDEYLQLGLDGIFLRPLSPFGLPSRRSSSRNMMRKSG